MKIVIAPDSYKESLTAMEVANAIEVGFRQIMPDAQYIKLPMADGGEGTVQSLIDASNGTIIEHQATGPLGERVNSFFGVMGEGKTAIIEMAAVSGLHLVPIKQRNPMLTTSYGTGELILAALDKGAEHIIIGIGGSATNDGGIGMAQALGARLLDDDNQQIGYGGNALARLARIDLRDVDSRLTQIKLEVACDVDNPLCGELGASHVFGPQKGATREMVEQLDKHLAHYASIIKRDVGVDVKNMPGAGAAGGMGAALVGLFNAELRPGIEIVMDAVNLAGVIKDADLIITGEGRIDSQTIHGKTLIGVARTAKRFNKAVIGIAGCLSNDCDVVYEHGIHAVFSVVPRSVSLEQALKDAAINVEQAARNIAAVYCLGR